MKILFAGVKVRSIVVVAITVAIVGIVGFVSGVPARAAGKIQYAAVNAHMQTVQDASAVQKVLDGMSTQGWEYIGSTSEVMIFKN